MNAPHLNQLAKRPGLSGRVHFVHGFNVSDGGEGTTGVFQPYYARDGFEVLKFNTTWQRGILRDLWNVRFNNKKLAQKLALKIEDGDVLVGHSNGCALISRALWYLASIGSKARVYVIYHNPALDKDTPLAPAAVGCLVFHTHTDTTVWWSKFRPCLEWGEMGKEGYREPDPDKYDARYNNLSYEHLSESGISFENMGHSNAFKSPARVDLMFSSHSRQIQYWTSQSGS